MSDERRPYERIYDAVNKPDSHPEGVVTRCAACFDEERPGPCVLCQEDLERLRSDDWLERAAEEIASDSEIECDGPGDNKALVLDILRKHRDAKP